MYCSICTCIYNETVVLITCTMYMYMCECVYMCILYNCIQICINQVITNGEFNCHLHMYICIHVHVYTCTPL